MSKDASKQMFTEPLGFFDRLSLAWLLPLLGLRLAFNFASMFLSQDEISGLNWRQIFPLAYLQASGASLTERQRAASSRSPLTGPRIQDYCRKHNLDHTAISLDRAILDSELDIPTPVLHIVTPLTAKPGGPTIFYSHGGGYHNPMRAEGHIPFLMRCAAACEAKQVVFLEYSLSPEQQYPCQLIQVVASLRFLLEKEGIQAENIILGGDSAGGHLTASLLTHIVHPSPYAPAIDLRSSQFKAVFLVSPWLTMSENLPQAPNDYLTQEKVNMFRKMFEPALNEVWSNPFEAEDAVAVWKRLFPGEQGHAICRKAILAVGTSEILLDSCLVFGRDFIGCENIRVGTKSGLDLVKQRDFVLAIAPGESHVQPGLDCALAYYDGSMMKAILTFLETC